MMKSKKNRGTNIKEIEDIYSFWNNESSGEIYVKNLKNSEYYEKEKNDRYNLEPYILKLAKFNEAKNKDVLEIGVGMGADHEMLALNKPKKLIGIDLTKRAINHVKKRFRYLKLKSDLKVQNAEELSFENDSFDFIYSWGVIHHSSQPLKIIEETYRVLRKGGIARIMIYNKYSIVGFMLWIRYALLKMKIFTSLNTIYDLYLESPHTKAYTINEARKLFYQYKTIKINIVTSFGDLLMGEVGARHNGKILMFFKKIFPRKLIKFISDKFNLGLYMFIEAEK